MKPGQNVQFEIYFRKHLNDSCNIIAFLFKPENKIRRDHEIEE